MASTQSKKHKLQQRRHKKEVKRRLHILSTVCAVLSAAVLTVGAYLTGFEYATRLATMSEAESAPAEVALLTAMPFLIAAVILLSAFGILLYFSKRKERSCVSEQ